MEKRNKIKNLSQNALLFTISGFGTRIISFFLVPLYTYVLSTDEFGSVDLVTTTVQLLIPVLTINIQDAVLRFSLDKNYKAEDAICVGFKIIGVSSALLGIILFGLDYSGIIPLESNYMFFLYLSFTSGALNNNLSMYLKAKDQVKTLAVWGITNTAVTCLVNLLLLLGMHLGINGYMIAYVSGTIVADVGMFLSGNIMKDLKISKRSGEIAREMVKYSAPLIANSLGWWINNASDRYILTYFCGAAVNGIYAVSYKIPSILSALQSIFYNAWSISSITEFDENDEDGFIGGTYTVYSSASFLACSLIMLFNITIAHILYSKNFFVAWKYVPFLLLGTAFNGLGLFNGCIFAAAKKTKEISITTVVSALINTALNFILIPLVGAYGAAFATMIGYFSIWFMRTLRMKSVIKMNVNWKKQVLMMIVLLMQCIAASANESFLYQLPFVLLLFVIQRKTILIIFDKLVLLLKR